MRHKPINPEKIREEALKVADAMQVYGGNFVAHLGQALEAADDDNTIKIKNAFPQYWETYLGMANRAEEVRKRTK